MLEKTHPRVRFAPAPTGMMHLGNIRTALMNYLMARQKNGVFILRIEDTDLERNFDKNAMHIQHDLEWLSLNYNEGPNKENASFSPYFQSQRSEIYQKELEKFIEKKIVYRCFCSNDELEKKRQRQIALKQPPRYDRICLSLDAATAYTQSLEKPFIWRMKINPQESITISDLTHGSITFDLKNFYDFPITRQDGSVTFMFANFIDDVLMKIDYVIRGEDHLSNTAGQAAMYKAYGAQLPIFWHLPILCNTDGKKLSKRDFGFSLQDLKTAGFLPEAIINYLAILGGSFKEEIMSKEELISAINFNNQSTTGQIKYDIEKLRWINHKWIAKLSLNELTEKILPFLQTTYTDANFSDHHHLQLMIKAIQKEMVTLKDASTLLAFYFIEPIFEKEILQNLLQEAPQKYQEILNQILLIEDKKILIESIKNYPKKYTLPAKNIYSLIRYLLTGNTTGLSIIDLLSLLSLKTINKRIKNALK